MAKRHQADAVAPACQQQAQEQQQQQYHEAHNQQQQQPSSSSQDMHMDTDATETARAEEAAALTATVGGVSPEQLDLLKQQLLTALTAVEPLTNRAVPCALHKVKDAVDIGFMLCDDIAHDDLEFQGEPEGPSLLQSLQAVSSQHRTLAVLAASAALYRMLPDAAESPGMAWMMRLEPLLQAVPGAAAVLTELAACGDGFLAQRYGAPIQPAAAAASAALAAGAAEAADAAAAVGLGPASQLGAILSARDGLTAAAVVAALCAVTEAVQMACGVAAPQAAAMDEFAIERVTIPLGAAGYHDSQSLLVGAAALVDMLGPHLRPNLQWLMPLAPLVCVRPGAIAALRDMAVRARVAVAQQLEQTPLIVAQDLLTLDRWILAGCPAGGLQQTPAAWVWQAVFQTADGQQV